MEDRDTVIVCAGTDGEYTLDDSLCAGMMVKMISEISKVQFTDAAISVSKLASLSSDVDEILEGSRHYSYLKKLGNEKDLEYCLSLNLFKNVPEYKNGVIALSKEK